MPPPPPPKVDVKASVGSWWVQALVVVLGSVVSYAVYAQLKTHETQHVHAITRQAAATAERLTSQGMDVQCAVLRRMAKRWTDSGPSRSDAASYIEDMGEIQAIEWVSLDGKVQWIEPVKGNEAAIGLDLTFEERRKAAIDRARSSGRVTKSRTIDLVQGEKGFLIFAPVYEGDAVSGFALGVYRVRSIMDRLFAPAILPGFHVQLKDGEETIYGRGQPPVESQAMMLQGEPMAGSDMSVWVAPSQKIINEHLTTVPAWAFVGGMISTLLLAASLRQIATSRAIAEHADHVSNQLRELSESLDEQVADRTRELDRVRLETETILDLIPSIILFKDTENRLLRVNRAAANVLGKTREQLKGAADEDLQPDHAEDLHKNDLEVINTGKPKTGIIETFVDGDGREHTSLTSKVPAFGEDGEVIGVVVVANDITDLQEAQDKLRLREEEFRSAFDFAPIGMALVATDTSWMRVNRALCDMLGYAPDEMVGKPMHDVTHPDDIELCMSEAMRVLAGEIPTYSMEKRYFRKDGSIILTMLSVSLVKDERDQPVHFVCHVRDITRWKQAQDALETSEQRFAIAMEASNSGLWVWDVVNNDTYFSDQWYTMIGLKPGELPMTFDTWSKLCHEEDRDRAMEAIRENFEGRSSRYRVEFRLKHKGGHWVWIQSVGQVIERSDEGKPMRMAGVHHNIDRIKQAEAALRESEQRLSLAMEAADEGLWVWNLRTNETYFNDPWFEMIGYAPNELPMTFDSWAKVCHPEDFPRSSDAIKAYLNGETDQYRIPVRVRHKEGHWLWIEDVGRIVERDEDGQPVKMAGVHFNIDRIKRAEEALAETNQRLRDTNDEIERLVYAVSHDLKSPIVTLQGFAELLREDLEAGRHDDAHGSLARITHASARMKQTIDDLLEFSRVGRMQLSIQPIDAEALRSRLMEEMAGRFERAGVTLTIQQPLPALTADPARLTEAIENLLTNALKYGSDAEQPTVELGGHQADGETRLFVRDNGKGIAPRFHRRVFDLFEQLEASSEGAGIGLAIVAKVMAVHGGRVWVESEEGKGATFWLALPDAPHGPSNERSAAGNNTMGELATPTTPANEALRDASRPWSKDLHWGGI